MKPGDWQRVKQIFQAALDLSGAERAAYVASAAAGDEDLRREVESLLASSDESDEFLAGPAVDYVPGVIDDEPPDVNIGRRIGPYRIVREIGSGGMGSVYLAERVDEFQQKAALKLMRRGMDSRLVVSRFRYERQILAGLDHPNIARLLDGGATDDGRPYFVMEYVDGVPIDAWCAKHALPVRARLELFRQVCSAVQYAHQNLVVHRDLKPGNILVGEDGIPKLLDFGIAKLLRQEAARETALTSPGVRPMTPEYASPEQVRGLPITTAADVYSLGVVLYELLAGKPPYQFATGSPLEIDRVICETDPPRPSAIALPGAAKALTGDLDRIVLKAMDKDPQRRYLSAEQLSEDIRRHLEGIPVMARPHTLMYRASRFVRRNRAAALGAMLVTVSLLAGLATTTWQARRAERRFNDVRRLAGSFLFEFDAQIRDLAGATPARRMIVERALQYLRSLAQEAGRDKSLKQELAEAYLKVGDVQGNPYVSNLGDTAGALGSYRQALALASDAGSTQHLARAHRSIGEVLPLLGDAAGAVPHLKNAVAVLEAVPAPDLASRFELSTCYEMLGDVMGHEGIQNLSDPKAARAAYDRALAIDEAIGAEQPANERARRGSAVVRMKLADMQTGAGEIDAALANYRAAAQILDALSAASPTNAALRRTALAVHRKLGVALETVGQLRGAMAEYAGTTQALVDLMKADPANRQAKMDYVVTLKNLGDLQYKLHNLPASASAYREAVEVLRPLAAAEPENTVLRSRLATMLVYGGDVLSELKQDAEALRLCREGLAVTKEIADRPGATAADLVEYAMQLIDCPIGELQDPPAAIEYARRAVAATNGAIPDYLEQLARAYYSADQAGEAVQVQQKVVSMLPESGRAGAEKRLAFFRAALAKK